jgi:hypothetical protein
MILDLRNIRIGTRFAAGFGIILAAMMVAIVGGNIAQQRNADRLLEQLRAASAKRELAAIMHTSILEAAVAMRNIGIQADVAGTQREEAKVKGLRERYDEALAGITKAWTRRWSRPWRRACSSTPRRRPRSSPRASTR